MTLPIVPLELEGESIDRSSSSGKFNFDKLVTEPPKLRGLASCNWAILVLTASAGFATCNIIMGDLAMRGMMTQYFNYNVGGVFVCLMYFIAKYLFREKDALLDRSAKPER
jgi:hypothetical protein